MNQINSFAVEAPHGLDSPARELTMLSKAPLSVAIYLLDSVSCMPVPIPLPVCAGDANDEDDSDDHEDNDNGRSNKQQYQQKQRNCTMIVVI